MSNASKSMLNDVATCGLHTRTPYGITNVSSSQFSIARHYGVIVYNGDRYVYFPDSDELIREDVLKWKRERDKTTTAPGKAALVLQYLKGRDWTSPTELGLAIWGVGHHSSSASPCCLRLVKAGKLERNKRGHYRIPKNTDKP